MRDVQQDTKNSLSISDTISGSDIKLFYRMPTTEERVRYQSGLFTRKGKKPGVNVELRLYMGLKILSGFEEAALVNGKYVGGFGYGGKPIASDQASANYRADWKDLLKETAADIILALAISVFEGVGLAKAEDGEEEENLPLATSSGD